ncbi:MAG: sensor histidine kinase [Actinomycetota bacterium]
MVASSRIAVVQAVLVFCAATVTVAIAVVHLPAIQAAVLIAAEGVIGLLALEVVKSRRRLVQEHAAHVAKSAYLANMSHELRTPLNAIIGFSEIIKDQMMGAVGEPRYVDYAGDIHASASHLLDMINDVLELSRIEAGRLELHEKVNELGPILVSCHRLLRERARRAGLILDVEACMDLPPVLCDATKVKEVVLNLLTNAIKFTPRGGAVRVFARREEGGVAIVVEDTGVGIPVDEIPKVLTPFQQAAHTHLMTAEGTGLGLPLAKRLIEMHGGQLVVESEVGKGTRITARLPASRCLGAAAQSGAPGLFSRPLPSQAV